jgi:hypothetical protein
MKKILIITTIILVPLLSKPQQVTGYQSSSRSNHPAVTWIASGLPDTIAFDVFRAPHGTQRFQQIYTWQNHFLRSDTLFLIITDTTLTEKGIWEYHVRLNLPDGRTLNSEVMMAHNMGYIPPPRIVNLETAPVADQKAITLTWELRNPETVVNQSIYRSYRFEDGYELIATVSSQTRQYTDPVSRSNEPWFYFILIKDFFGYQPPGVRVFGISEYAEQPFPPQDFSAATTGDDIAFNWRKVGDNIFNYRLYRRVNQQGWFFPVGDPFFIPGANISKTIPAGLTDETTSLEFYCTSISDGYIESSPSDTVQLYFPANVVVLPPAQVDHIVNADGTVTLLWPAREDGAVAGYNVYRGMGDTPFQKLNSEPLLENIFHDQPVGVTGKIIYQVESVNIAGKPSALRTEVVVEREPMVVKLVLSCSQVRNGIQLEWAPLSLEGIKTLQIYRQKDDNEPSLLSRVENSRGTYTDSRAVAGETYIYIVMAEMNDGRVIMVNDGVIAGRH